MSEPTYPDKPQFECRAETVVAGIRIQCGDPPHDEGRHGWSGLMTATVERMAQAAHYAGGYVLVVTSPRMKTVERSQLEANGQGSYTHGTQATYGFRLEWNKARRRKKK